MTVKELIERLSAMPPDAEVVMIDSGMGNSGIGNVQFADETRSTVYGTIAVKWVELTPG